MKRTWRMRLGNVRVQMQHGRDNQGVWSGAQYAVQMTGAVEGVPQQGGRELITTMSAARARSLARVLNDMADAVDNQNLHAGYRVSGGSEDTA